MEQELNQVENMKRSEEHRVVPKKKSHDSHESLSSGKALFSILYSKRLKADLTTGQAGSKRQRVKAP